MTKNKELGIRNYGTKKTSVIHNSLFTIKNNGVVVIPTVLMLGGLIVTIALAVSLTTYLLSNSNYGVRLSIESLTSARAGLQDGILKIIKDNKFSTAALGYRFDPNTCVVVKTTLINNPDVLQKEVIATSSSFTRYHQLRSVVQINENTGELKIFSTEEIPISGYVKCQ